MAQEFEASIVSAIERDRIAASRSGAGETEIKTYGKGGNCKQQKHVDGLSMVTELQRIIRPELQWFSLAAVIKYTHLHSALRPCAIERMYSSLQGSKEVISTASGISALRFAVSNSSSSAKQENSARLS